MFSNFKSEIFSELQHLQDVSVLQVPHLQASQGRGQETLEIICYVVCGDNQRKEKELNLKLKPF